MNTLTDFIISKENIWTQQLQEEISSTLDLHLPECDIGSDSLSPQQLYNEVSLHAYAYHRVVWPLANTIMGLFYQGFLPDDPNEVLERTYIPKSRQIIKSQFDKLYGNTLDDTFYKQLPDVADHTGIKYLQYFLPSDKLPKIRKPYMRSEPTIDEKFILRASEPTIYNKGVLVKKPNRGYGQYCQWEKCKDRTEFKSVYYKKFNNNLFNPANGCRLYYSKNGQLLSIKVVKLSGQKSKPILFFVCSKHCYDALRVSLKRKHQLPN